MPIYVVVSVRGETSAVAYTYYIQIVLFVISLTVDGSQRARLPMQPTAKLHFCLWSRRTLPYLSPVQALDFSTLRRRQSLKVEVYLLTFLKNSALSRIGLTTPHSSGLRGYHYTTRATIFYIIRTGFSIERKNPAFVSQYIF